MIRKQAGLGLGALLLSSAGVAQLQNADFADFDQPASGTAIPYATGEGPPDWLISISVGGGRVVFSDTGAEDGRAWYGFNTPTDRFGENKLEQCVPIDPAQNMSFTFSIFADVANPGSGLLRFRINPNFYETREGCLADQFDGGGSANRISAAGFRDNDDIDHRFTSDQGQQWLTFSPANPPSNGNPLYLASEIPPNAQWMNLSVRSRNDGVSDPPDGPVIRVDNIIVTQGSSTTNIVTNGSFEAAELFDGNPLAGMSGWVVNRDGDAARRAAVGPQPFALSGDNVFWFEDLTGNFGSSRLDQCFPLVGQDVGPSIFAWTRTPASPLEVRLNVDFYASADCSGDEDGALRIRQDFSLATTASEWVALVADTVRTPGEYGAAQSALFSVRARDRSGPGGDGPGEFQRIIYFDEASEASAVATPTFSPAPGSFVDSVTVTLSSATPGVVIYYTLDGSLPDDSSASVASGGTVEITSTSQLQARAFLDGQFSGTRSGTYTITDPPPPVTPPRQLDTGCSMIPGQPSALDPTLWVLALLAAAGLLRRRSRQPL